MFPTKSERHYHIRWSNSNVDWKAFPSSEEAEKLAKQIKRPNESYVIEEQDAECERCRPFKPKRAQLFL